METLLTVIPNSRRFSKGTNFMVGLATPRIGVQEPNHEVTPQKQEGDFAVINEPGAGPLVARPSDGSKLCLR
jgi:hypothetical protein